MTGVVAGMTDVVAGVDVVAEMDVVAETTPVLAERTRLPRLRSLVWGGGATVALAALTAFGLPIIVSNPSPVIGHAPAIQVPELATGAVPYQYGHRAVKHRVAKHKTAKHDAAVKDLAVPTLPSLTPNVGARNSVAPQQLAPGNDSHVVSNVQDSGNTNANANADTQMKANSSVVTSANKHVSSNRSVNISNSSVQKMKSGSVKNSTSVRSSVKVAHSHTYSKTSG